MKIASDLSDLIFYCHSVRFQSFAESQQGGFQLMSSFNEKKAFELISEKKRQASHVVSHTERQFFRIYPNGRRVDSSNYDPQPLWNCGVQLVALNYQYPDRPMWINSGKFSMNGRCGYVLKPEIMRSPGTVFDPYDHHTWTSTIKPLSIDLHVVSARHLVKPGRGIASPYVEVEVVGVDADQPTNKRRTQVVQDNGFKPFWNEKMPLLISMPELACICITVFDEDMFGDSNAIGQAVIPIGSEQDPARSCLRSGWRSIQLNNIHGFPMELSSLLVKIDFKYERTDHDVVQNLREEMRRLNIEREELVKLRADASRRGVSLEDTDQRLEAVNNKIFDVGSQLLAKESAQTSTMKR